MKMNCFKWFPFPSSFSPNNRSSPLLDLEQVGVDHDGVDLLEQPHQLLPHRLALLQPGDDSDDDDDDRLALLQPAPQARRLQGRHLEADFSQRGNPTPKTEAKMSCQPCQWKTLKSPASAIHPALIELCPACAELGFAKENVETHFDNFLFKAV